MKVKKIISLIILAVAVPAVIFIGTSFFGGRQYTFIAFAVVILSFIPFVLKFENDERITAVRMVLIAVMTTLSVVGRFAFSYVPFFKPVAAFVIITGVYLGAESGFMCGALSAVISNFIFGQGAWTPFQMFAWGMIGFFAGLLGKALIKYPVALYFYGALSGVAYSLFLDTWTTMYIDGTFNFSRYLTLITAAVPVTVVYVVSNVLFLVLLFRPVGKRLERMTIKYGLKKQSEVY